MENQWLWNEGQRLMEIQESASATPRMIQVREQHLSSEGVYVELANAIEEDREISDACAVTIASWYQMPDTGSAFAAFASGAEVEWQKVYDDLSYVIKHHYKQADRLDKLALDFLGTYLINWGNPPSK